MKADRARLAAAADQVLESLRVLGVTADEATAVFLIAATRAGTAHLETTASHDETLHRLNDGLAVVAESWRRVARPIGRTPPPALTDTTSPSESIH